MTWPRPRNRKSTFEKDAGAELPEHGCAKPDWHALQLQSLVQVCMADAVEGLEHADVPHRDRDAPLAATLAQTPAWPGQLAL